MYRILCVFPWARISFWACKFDLSVSFSALMPFLFHASQLAFEVKVLAILFKVLVGAKVVIIMRIIVRLIQGVTDKV